MVVVRLGFQDAGSCDVVGVVGAFRLVAAFDAFLGDPALVSGSLENRDPASGTNTEVQRQPHLPSSRLALLTYFGASAGHHSLYCMAWTDAALLDVAGHIYCLAT